jgi:hypothetical protein
MKKKKLDPTEAAKKHVNCPCGRCRTPSLPFTPHDLPNFGTGAEGRHLEGRIAATAVALDETEKEFDKVNVYLVEALDRAEKVKDSSRSDERSASVLRTRMVSGSSKS